MTQQTSSDQEPGPSEVDVVVVGFGAAAMAAAITVHDGGGSVVLLEKMPEAEAGGNTRVSGQVWFSPTDVERAKVHLRSQAQDYPISEAIVAAWAEETSRNTDWVRARVDEVAGRVPRDPRDPYPTDGTGITKISCGQEMGAKWDPSIPEDEFPELEGNDCGTEWFYIGPSQGFSRLWLTLKACVELRGIPVRYSTRATELVRAESGAVCGVVASTPQGSVTVHARRGVILACGGFENNQEMVRDYLRLPVSVPWGSPANTGDGHKMAMKVGADLWHMHNYMSITGLRVPGYESGEWVEPAGKRYILVGRDGRRFMDDSTQSRHGKAMIRGGFEMFPGFDHYMVFDEAARLAGPLVFPVSDYAANWLKQVHRYEWSADSSVEIENGWIVRGDTIEELAEKLGIDGAGLAATVAEYNGFCRDGRDRRFDRPPATMAEISQGPFYGFRWGGVLMNTLGGPRKDEAARVVDAFGEPIPGLYCAGEISATYTWMLEGGQSIGDAFAFGRIAGRNALEEPVRAGTTAESVGRA